MYQKTCIECGSFVDDTKKTYKSGSVTLISCPNCHNVADKYIEYDILVIFFDMLLHKPAVYRHLLYNTYMARHRESFFFIKLLLFFLALETYGRLEYLKFLEQETIFNPHKSLSRFVSAFTLTLTEHIVHFFFLFLSVSLFKFKKKKLR